MNTSQDHELPEKIVALLVQGARELDSETAAKLLAIRKEALAHYQEAPAPATVQEWATTTLGRIAEPFSYNLRAGIVLLAFLGSVAGVIAWQSTGPQGSEIAEIDEALLTDELPINAYLDKGFDTWAKRP